MNEQEMINVVIIGAGVIGVSTAYRLLQAAPYLSVTVVADKFSPDNTSDGLAGVWEPYEAYDTPKELVKSWGRKTYEHAMHLIHCDPQAKNYGMFSTQSVILSDKEHSELPDYWDFVDNPYVLTEQELKRYQTQPKSGYTYNTVFIIGRLYVPMLMKKISALGGKFLRKKINNFNEVANFDLIINCCGLGARELSGDQNVFPARGHLVRVKAPWIKTAITYETKEGDTYYVLPNIDDVVVGGSYEVGNFNTDVIVSDRERIMKNATNLVPSLKDSEYITDWVGLRPGRTSVRLEKEDMFVNGKTLKVVHNYGHSGIGITLHWGCAEDAVKLALKSIAEIKSVKSKL